MLVTYRQLRQSVKMWVGSCEYLVVIIFSVLSMAISSALKMVCNPGSIFIFVFLVLLDYILYTMFFLFSSVRPWLF